MEFNFNVFYSTVCQVCKNQPTLDSKFCSGCKLVQYCSGFHQKEDWLDHKDFCKAIKNLIKKTGSDHVYKDIFGFTGQDYGFWNDLRSSVLKLVTIMMKRSLNFVETQILLFPPLCNFCHTYEQNKMYSCVGCNSVMYCSKEHQINDSKHKDSCKNLFLAFKIDMQRYFNQNTAYNFKMLNDLKVSKKIPESIDKIFKPYNQNLSSEELLLSEPLSYCTTLAFAINQVNKASHSYLTVHVVGADEMEFFAIKTLPIFFRMLPALKHLQIVMIGPNLPKNFFLPTKFQENCSLHLVAGKLYHEYRSSSDFIHPDVVAIFNCGFCEFLHTPEKDRWKHSLPVILSLSNATVVLTSYNAKESTSDFKRLCDMGEIENVQVVMESKENPFGSLYPHRDWEIMTGGVFYVNKYISILNTNVV